MLYLVLKLNYWSRKWIVVCKVHLKSEFVSWVGSVLRTNHNHWPLCEWWFLIKWDTSNWIHLDIRNFLFYSTLFLSLRLSYPIIEITHRFFDFLIFFFHFSYRHDCRWCQFKPIRLPTLNEPFIVSIRNLVTYSFCFFLIEVLFFLIDTVIKILVLRYLLLL